MSKPLTGSDFSPNGTFFMRNKAQLAVLFDKIFPAYGKAPITCFVHAASTGKEPYSMAIKNRSGYGYDLRIYAGDYNPENIRKMREARYSREEMDLYSSFGYMDGLDEFFVASEDGTRTLVDSIRGGVEIVGHPVDVTKSLDDMPRADFVFCQNCLFYHDAETQGAAIDNLASQSKRWLVVSGFHEDRIAGDMRRNHFVPFTEGIEQIHEGWLVRRRILDSKNPTDRSFAPVGLGSLDKAMPDWEYRYCSIFERKDAGPTITF